MKVSKSDFGLNPARQRLFNGQGQAFPFPTDGTVFAMGSTPQSPTQQADAKFANGQLWLRDRGAKDTFVNGEAIDQGKWVAVPERARIGLGNPCNNSLVLGVGRPQGVGGSQQPARYRLRLADGQLRDLPQIVLVGRQSDCGLQLSDPTVSRQHAWLAGGPGSLKVYDVGSTQGTTIDGQRIEPKQWHSVPLGAELRFGNEPVIFEAEKPLLISYYGDGSTPDIAAYVKCQPGNLEPSLAKTGAPVMVRGAVAQGGTLKALAYTAAPALMAGATAASLAVAGAAMAGSGGPVLALLEAGVGIASGALTYQLRHFWKGGLTSLKEKARGFADWMRPWSHVQTKVISKSPKMSQFQQLWAENQRAFPSARHVVYISGHGDQKSAAGLYYKEIAQTVQGAEMIMLDACNGAQLESLSKLTDSAQVAIASEHKVNGLGFPMDMMFARPHLPQDPRQLAAEMVESTSHVQRAESLVAIDLPALKTKLLPALDGLGPALLQQRDFKKQIKAALKESERSDTGRLSPKVDLGSFLAGLAEIPGLQHACPQLNAARSSFDQTVLAMMGAGTLTFDLRPDKQLPEGWRQFLKKL